MTTVDAVTTASGRGSFRGDGRLLLAQLLDQRLDLLGGLGTDRHPVVGASQVDAQRLGLAAGNRVVETDTLDVPTVTLVALVGHDDVVERGVGGAGAGEADPVRRARWCRARCFRRESAIVLERG